MSVGVHVRVAKRRAIPCILVGSALQSNAGAAIQPRLQRLLLRGVLLVMP